MGTKSAFQTFGTKYLARGRCTKLTDAGVSKPFPEKARWEIFQASRPCSLGCNSSTNLLLCIVAQKQPWAMYEPVSVARFGPLATL